jgi:hypothetical protein
MTSSPPAAASPDTDKGAKPHRFIFNDVDMDKFRESAARKQLLHLTNAMGKSCASSKSDYTFDPQTPLLGLSPAMAALHGSLRAMLTWFDSFPPLDQSQVRFGNPSFRKWHERLENRSVSIVYNILKVQQDYPSNQDVEIDLLQSIADHGYEAAAVDKKTETIEQQGERAIVVELMSYLQAAFGHPVRLDYGTGHESSFQVFIYTLCKLGCFASTPHDQAPATDRLKAITLSIYEQYLKVTRQLQTEYMLEPAGSHGVWGLDDYYCLAFYFGACQLQADGGDGDFTPDSINDDSVLQTQGDHFMYFGCIRYIKSLKKGVPFFESSPMLHDISQLPTWSKVATGLLRLYEGEVLNKRQVVQHFQFGNIFAADWTASEEEREAPTTTFRHGKTVAPMARAPWADDPKGGMPPTKAPWAK